MAELARRLETSIAAHAARVAHRLDASRFTYSELDRASAAIAAFLADTVPRGQPVLVHGERGHEMIASFVGCLRAGNPYVPAGELIPPARCREMARAAGCRLVLDTNGGAAVLAGGGIEVQSPARIAEILSGEGGGGWERAVRGEELVYILFTSGSTGVPKGVKVSAGNIESFLDWTAPAFGYAAHPTAFLNQAPFHFDLSVYELYNALTTGGSLASLSGKHARDPEALFRRLFAYGDELETWVSTPSFLHYCATHTEFRTEKFPRLRQFVLIGEVFPVPLARETLRRFPRAQVLNFYGPTEATVAHTVFEVTEASLAGRSELPVGYVKPGSRVLLEDGEIILEGPNVAHGYQNGSAADDSKFYRSGEARRYRTGDLGELDADGLLHFRGRRDSQVKVNGFRVELGKIERVLGALPGISSCCVMLVEEENLAWIAAFVQTASAGIESEIAFRRRVNDILAAHLPAYMLPKRFVRVSEMPLNGNGKLDRQSLRGML